MANRFEVRGAWQRRNQVVDYKEAAYKQEQYREFLNQTMNNMDKWNDCF